MRIRYDRTYRIRLYVAIIFMIILYVFTAYTKNNRSLNVIEMMNVFMASRPFVVVLPAIVSMLCSDISLEDLTSRNIYLVLQRSSRTRYIMSRISEIVLMSLLFVAATFIMCNLVTIIMTGSVSWYGIITEKIVAYTEQMFKRLLVFFVFCVTWGCIGSFFSIVFRNRSAGYVFPFIISYLLMWLRENYLKDLDVIDPSFWMSDVLMTKGNSTQLFLSMILVFITVVISYHLYLFREISRRE